MIGKITLQPAVKYIKPMKILMYAPQYAGKTLSSLKLANGIVQQKRGCTEEEAWKHIMLVDSEHGRGALYSHIGPYNYFEITPPYHPDKVTNAMSQLDMMDQIDIVIYDSLTHYWSKDGGVLALKAAKDAQGGNSYTNWQEFTAIFNKMIDTLLASDKHIIATTRSKNDTAMVENAKGKMAPKTYGLKPDLRDGIEYDFDIVFNVDKSTHNLVMDKGVPGIKPVYEMATPETGKELYVLFNSDTVVKERTETQIIDDMKTIIRNHNMVQFTQLELSGRKLDELTKEELINLENKIKDEIKKQQINKAK